VPHANLKPSSPYSHAYPLGRVAAETLVALQSLRAKRYPILLESAAASLHGDNHDILMAFPGERLNLLADDTLQLPRSLQAQVTRSFLPTLDRWWHSLRSHSDSTLPFHGGWFLFLGYELAAQIETKLSAKHFSQSPKSSNLVAQALRIPAAIVRHCDSGEAWFVAEHETAGEFSVVQADLRAANEITSHQASQPSSQPLSQHWVLALQEESPEIFLDAVQAALQHIAAGDIYQANLSRRWQAELAKGATAHDLYRCLRKANPAPFAGLALLDAEHAVISSSPERLIEMRNGWVSTRPIAGTRPRARDAGADAALINELRAHPKERAEHVMLLDLERNDLGRLCVGGTVEVNEYMSIESYTHVHHIVSNVRGQLRSDVTPGQAIAAVFPGGTITGCPKLRCMEIIAELEQTPRGAYTGAMGYLNRDGSMDLNILIRTVELQGKQVQFRAGAGIVADSIPQRELEETRAKALGLVRALQA
jgi:anthranilate synthase component 1